MPLGAGLRAARALPSSVYTAAVRAGGIRPDAAQEGALGMLDGVCAAMPSYERDMLRHGAVRAAWETRRRAAEDVERRRVEGWDAGWAGSVVRGTRGFLGFKDVRPEDRADAYYGIAERPVAPVPPVGVYLHGDVGCGKSMLMDMMFACVGEAGARRVHYHAFMASLYQVIHRYDCMGAEERRARGLRHPLDAAVKLELGRDGLGAGLLCFDEFQVADVGDARLMHGVLSRLLESGTVVCFTANRPPGALNRSQLQDDDFRPFLDLLHERCNLIEVKSGIDYREVLSKADASILPSYLPSNAPISALHELWRAAARCEWDEIVTRTLPVAYGREFTVQRASPRLDAVQVSTEELLDAPVGASDYRALAERARVIFFTDVVPIFSADNRNLARRFITLVDICYECKTRLVMRTEAAQLDDMFNASAADIDAASMAEGLQFEGEVARDGVGAGNRALDSSTLYTGEDEEFAFRRAISRLKEMQTGHFATHRIEPSA